MNRRHAVKLAALTSLAFTSASRSVIQATERRQVIPPSTNTPQMQVLAPRQSRWQVRQDRLHVLEVTVASGLTPLKQPTQTSCGPTAIWSLCRYVEHLVSVQTKQEIQLPGYEEIQKFLQGSETSKKFNFKDFVSWQTTHCFWRDHVAPKSRIKLQLSKGRSVADLAAALERTGKPILVPYIMPYRAACILNTIRIPLALITLLQSERVYSSELPLGESGEIVMRGYPHCALIVKLTKHSESDDNPTIHLLDPWKGKMVTFSARAFERRWLSYYPSIGRSRFAKRMLPIFEELAAPGSYSTLEEM